MASLSIPDKGGVVVDRRREAEEAAVPPMVSAAAGGWNPLWAGSGEAGTMLERSRVVSGLSGKRGMRG